MAEENKELEDIQEANSDNNSEVNSSDINTDEEQSTEDIKEEFVKKDKKSLLSKILISLVAFLLFILTIGVVLYFLGFFDPKQIAPVTEDTKENMVKENTVETNEYKFDLKDINSKKLNEQLAYLTNKNLNQEKIDEKEKLENEKKIIEEEKKKKEEALKAEEELINNEKAQLEAKRIELENQKAELELLKQEALSLKEEMIIAKSQLENAQKVQVLEEKPAVEEIKDMANDMNSIKSIEDNIRDDDSNNFIQLVSVARIKGELYKSYLDRISSINSKVLLCRDDKNKIEIFLGPFDESVNRTEIVNSLVKNSINEAYEVELTKEEFDKRCNY